MKITRRQLYRLISEIVYVNPEGDAVAPDYAEPYSFMAGHPNEKIKTLGSHKDKKIRKMAAHLADSLTGSGAKKYSTMGAKEREVHQMHKDLTAKDQSDKLGKIGFGSSFWASAPRDQDTIFKNMLPDPRQVQMITRHVNSYTPQIEQVAGDWVFSSNRYHDYLEDFNRGSVSSRTDGLESLLYDVSEIVLDDVPQLSRIIKIYDNKEEHDMLNAILLKIKFVIHDYLMFDRGLYDLFYSEDGRGRDR